MAPGADTDALGRVGGGDTRRRPTSEGGRGHTAPAPSSSWRRAVERYKKSVWAPVASKALAILCGMLALAAIGASSIASGSKSGVEVPSAAPAASFKAGGMAAFLAQKAPEPPAASPPPDAAPPSAGLTEDGKVILNQADVADLRKLPGVGQKRAQAILELRAKLGGRFKKLSDLLRVKGIGPKSLIKWKDKLVLDAPKPDAAKPDTPKPDAGGG
jgi:competence protein ComEA